MNNIKKILLFFALFALVGTAGCAKEGYVASKVFVDGVSIGKMSRDEAIAALENVKIDSEESVVINTGDTDIKLFAEEIGAHYDMEQTVDEAIEKSRGVFAGLMKKEYEPKIKIDDEMLDKALREKLADYETPVVETSAEITQEGILVTNGITGVQINRTEAKNKIKNEFENGDKNTIMLSVEKTAPKSVNYDEFLASFGAEYKEGEYILQPDGTITVTEVVPGCSFDKTAAIEIMKSHTKEGESYVIPCEIKMPPYTKEEMEQGIFRDTLASFTTDFSSSSANRSDNIALASSSINGIVMMPGDVFSFNEALGERTSERGYKPAGAYAAGETVTAVGGGICQVSSTLYNTVLLSNLEIVSRKSHQMTVSYVKVGRDATVNWGTTDFKFKNNSGHPCKIVSSVSGKKLTVSIVGTQTIPDMRVEILTNTVSVIEPEEKIVEDPEKEVGYKSTKKGSNGYVVDAQRVVYSNGVEIKRENLTRSRYNPTKTVVTIGTKVVEETANNAQNNSQTTDNTQNNTTSDDTQMPPGLLPPA